MRKGCLFFLLIIITLSAYSQRWKLGRFEMVYGIGTSNYFGDIGGSDKPDKWSVADLDFRYTRPVVSVGCRYKIKEKVSIKANLNYAYIYGSDANSLNDSRSYSFSSNIFEIYGHIEYELISAERFMNYSSRGIRDGLKKFHSSISVYTFVGIGGILFFPKAKDDFAVSERFVNNKHIALGIPLGFGVRYPLNSQLHVGFEFGGRFTSTDYIDGFSPKASKTVDMYYISVINISYKVKKRSFRRKNPHF